MSGDKSRTPSESEETRVGDAAARPSPFSFQPGDTIDGYRLVRLLGQGGMGRVYLARQDHPSREVAVKLILSGRATPEVLARFELEGEVLGRLRHPGIAQIYTAGTLRHEDGDIPYLVMEYVEGRPLRESVASMSRRRRLELLAEVCDALEHAHQRGVIHRDLKPANILVTPEGQPKLLDFGVARVVDPSKSDLHDAQLTTAGLVVGTLHYMSPEQTHGDPGEVDTRSDVYALGVVGYELMAGRLPYALPRDPYGMIAAIRDTVPQPLGKIVPECRGDIEIIIGKALEKQRERRYASAGAMAGDLRRYLENRSILARPPSIGYRLGKFARRNPALTAALMLALVLLVGGVAGIANFAVREQAARQVAEQEARRAVASLDFIRTVLSQANPALAGTVDVPVRDALQAASRMIGVSYADQPELEVELRTLLGNVLLSQGDFEASQEELDRALEIAEVSLPEDGSKRLLIESQAAQAMIMRGQLAEAIVRLQEVVERMESQWPGDALPLLEARKELARARVELGDTVGLENEVREMLARLPDYGLQATAMLRIDLETLRATLVEERGDRGAALAIRREIVETARRELGEDSPVRLVATDNLALALSELGRLDEAVAMQMADIETFVRNLGPDHHTTIRAQSNLGALLLNAGRAEPARELLEDVYSRLRGLPDSHDLHVHVAANLASVAYFEGRLEAAESFAAEAVEHALEHRGELDEASISAMLSYAAILTHRDRFEDARRWHLRVLEALSRRYGENHPASLQAESEYAALLRDAGKLDAAIESFAELLPRIEAALGMRAPQTLMTLYQFSGALQQAGRHAEALPLSERLLANAGAVLGESNPFSLLAPNRHARSLIGVGRLDEAEVLLEESWRQLEAIPGLSVEWRSWIADSMVELYTVRGDAETAEQWRQRSEALADQRHGAAE